MNVHIFLLSCLISIPPCLLCVSASTKNYNQLCLDEICANKCCPKGEVWNSTSLACQKKSTTRVQQPNEKQEESLSVGTSFACPEGKKLSYIDRRQITNSHSVADCIEDIIIINETLPKLIRKVFTCADSSGNETSTSIAQGGHLKHHPTVEKTNGGKIPLIKCCLGADSFYSLGKKDCKKESDQRPQWPPPVYTKEGNLTVNISAEDFDLMHALIQCDPGFVDQRTTDFQLYLDGTMSVHGLANNLDFHGIEQFCVENLVEYEKKPGHDFAVQYCVPDICNTTTCVRKCCPIGYGMNEELHSCEPLDEPFVPEFYQYSNLTMTIPEEYFLRAGVLPDCQHGIAPVDPDLYPDDTFYLQASGDLYFPSYPEHEQMIAEYCIDNFFTGKGSNISMAIKGLNCFPPQEETPEDIKAVLQVFPYLMFASALFLVATFVVYAFVPELRNLHGITIMCYVSSLAITYICLGIIQIDGRLPNGPCIGLAIVVHFTFLAAFTWLSVLSFDIWFTLSDTRARSTRRNPIGVACSRRFILYSIYAWGLPLMIVVIGQILDSITDLPTSIIKPNFGLLKCWFHDNGSLLVYLYGPVAVLLAGDIVFFIMTATRLYRVSKDSAFATRNRHTKQKLRVIFSLFILMGVSWITEIISFAAGGPAYIWIPTDILNILTGVFIFIIFVCKKKVLRLLRKRYRALEKHFACFRRGSADWDNQDKSVYSKSQSNKSSQMSDPRRKISMTTMTHVSVRNSCSDADSA